MLDEYGVEILEQGDIFSEGTNQSNDNNSNGTGSQNSTSRTNPTTFTAGDPQQQQVIIVGGENKTEQTESKGTTEVTETDYTEILEAIERKISTTNQSLVVTNNNNLLYYKTNVQMMGLVIGMLLIFLFIGRLR